MWCNTQVSFSASPDNARSESDIEANPLNPLNLVGASKRFNNPATYDFTLAAYSSFDGGESWVEAAPFALLGNADPHKAWGGISDPAIAWDNAGNCFLAALPFPGPGSPYPTLGIAIYRSSDGGRTWSAPNFIHPNTNDDKQWATGDPHPTSPYYGRVYVAWDNGSQLAFARTLDNGATWRGVGANAVGWPLAADSFSPTVTVMDDGAVVIFWIAWDTIKFVKSTDGGDSFSAPQAAVTGVTTLSGNLPMPGGFPELPGGTFRVLTLPTSCAGTGGSLVVAWPDLRDGVSRIYYRRSADRGASWLGPASGAPLLPFSPAATQHDFHPQLAGTPSGQIGCAYYEFGPKTPGGASLIDVHLATSANGGASFGAPRRVSTTAWNPAVDAPLSHGDQRTTFIGDYFGLAGTRGGFIPFWTDTRTGIQEIFCGRAMSMGPRNGVQFRATVAGGTTQRWAAWGWPACWHVAWDFVPTTPRPGAPQLRWKVQVEREMAGYITYWLSVTNLSASAVEVEARYTVFAFD